MSVIVFIALFAQARQSGFTKYHLAGCHVLVRYAELMAQGQVLSSQKIPHFCIPKCIRSVTKRSQYVTNSFAN
jgi:hypothetical protein